MTGEHVTKEDYLHGKKVFEHFKCENMRKYSELYLKTDVMLLAEVFQTFRKHIMGVYGLEPCHYFTLPGLSWDAMLKFTGIKLDLMTDIELYNFINVKHVVANNKHMKNYDPTEPDKCVDYVDANNLYGMAMCCFLPEKEFAFIEPRELKLDEAVIKNTKDDADYGYIVEVDIDYNPKLHDLHDDLPFFPEKKKPPGSKHEKLLLDFEHKKNYVVHYTYLKQAIAHGLEIKKFHKILRFKQSAYLKPYIENNNAYRSVATSDFQKDLWKLFNNAIFGKC